MGAGRWDSATWAGTRATFNAAHTTIASIFTTMDAASIAPEIVAADIKLRESRDSAANPESTALIVALDVTGSMGRIADVMAREGLGTLIGQIYDRKPIADPHVMIMGIGDFECDRQPLQATQFEAENDPLITQLHKIYLEHGGGGNHYESYAAAWLFAATKTSIDCFEKRGKKGYLFTVGDEEPTPLLHSAHIKRFMGLDMQDVTGVEALALASNTYEVFHVVVEEGAGWRGYLDKVRQQWADVLGQHVLPLADHTKLAEVIVSAIEVTEGRDKDAVAASWSGTTSVVVANAIRDVARGTNVPGALKLNY